MQIESRTDAEVAILDVTGTVDLYEGYLLRDEARKQFRAGVRSLVFECHGISYVDSTGLGIFLHVREMAREAGGRVALVAPGPAFQKVLATTQVNRLLPVFDTLDEAMALVRG